MYPISTYLSISAGCTAIHFSSSVFWANENLNHFFCGDPTFILSGDDNYGNIYRQRYQQTDIRKCPEGAEKHVPYTLRKTSPNTWKVLTTLKQ